MLSNPQPHQAAAHSRLEPGGGLSPGEGIVTPGPATPQSRQTGCVAPGSCSAGTAAKRSPPGKRVHQATGSNSGERFQGLVKTGSLGSREQRRQERRPAPCTNTRLCRLSGGREEGMGTARRSKWGKNVHVIKHGKIKRGRKRCGYVQRFIQPRLGNCSSKKSLIHPVPPQSLSPSMWGPHRSEPPGVCGGSWRRRHWGPAVPGSLFAGVLSPRLQPLPSARLGACPDGEGGGGRTWKQKGGSGLCSLAQSWHRAGWRHPRPRENGRFCVPWSRCPLCRLQHCSRAGHSPACPPSPQQGDKG